MTWETKLWSKGFTFYTPDFTILLGENSTLSYGGKYTRRGSEAEAREGILAQAQHLRDIADAIERAMAEAPKEAKKV